MTACRRVYGFGHLRADYRGPGSAPEVTLRSFRVWDYLYFPLSRSIATRFAPLQVMPIPCRSSKNDVRHAFWGRPLVLRPVSGTHFTCSFPLWPYQHGGCYDCDIVFDTWPVRRQTYSCLPSRRTSFYITTVWPVPNYTARSQGT